MDVEKIKLLNQLMLAFVSKHNKSKGWIEVTFNSGFKSGYLKWCINNTNINTADTVEYPFSRIQQAINKLKTFVTIVNQKYKFDKSLLTKVRGAPTPVEFVNSLNFKDFPLDNTYDDKAEIWQHMREHLTNVQYEALCRHIFKRKTFAQIAVQQDTTPQVIKKRVENASYILYFGGALHKLTAMYKKDNSISLPIEIIAPSFSPRVISFMRIVNTHTDKNLNDLREWQNLTERDIIHTSQIGKGTLHDVKRMLNYFNLKLKDD